MNDPKTASLHATSGGLTVIRSIHLLTIPRVTGSVPSPSTDPFWLVSRHLVGVAHAASTIRSTPALCGQGIPYHRGYLFYGPPGTGKASLVSALAAHFGLSIYSMNLADFNDRTLMNAVNPVSRDSVMLFEDIDCMKSSNAREPSKEAGTQVRDEKQTVSEKNGVTLSGLLNVLDGFYAPTNVLFMMTTNRIETLDDALLRPGRIDYKLYLGKSTNRQRIELYRRFFPEASEFEAEAFVEENQWAETMAEFQGLLLGLEQEARNPVREIA